MKREVFLKWKKEIAAFTEGKAIQERWNKHKPLEWIDANDPLFGEPYWEFRVKPKLVEGWVNVISYGDGTMNLRMYKTEASAKESAAGYSDAYFIRTAVPVKEVT